MGRGLSDPSEMQIIYDVSKDVYDGKYAVAYALKFLKGKVKGTESSLKMYFNIFSCMRYRQSQIKAAVKVNTEMLKFYWNLGRDIVTLKAEGRPL